MAFFRYFSNLIVIRYIAIPIVSLYDMVHVVSVISHICDIFKSSVSLKIIMQTIAKIMKVIVLLTVSSNNKPGIRLTKFGDPRRKCLQLEQEEKQLLLDLFHGKELIFLYDTKQN